MQCPTGLEQCTIKRLHSAVAVNYIPFVVVICMVEVDNWTMMKGGESPGGWTRRYM